MTLSIFTRFPVESYSRAGEDVIAAQYFPDGYKGVYVDAGCYLPVDYSNTYKFYTMGWRGLCIDANPDFAAKYAEIRPEDTFINSGLAPQPGELTFYRTEEDLSSSTFLKQQADLLVKRANMTITEVPVKVRSLNEILAEQNVTRIDVLNIDIEFLDEAIILDFDFNRWQPRLIMIEDLFFLSHQPHASIIFQWLTKIGYTLVSRCLHTCIYVAPSTDAEKAHHKREITPTPAVE